MQARLVDAIASLREATDGALVSARHDGRLQQTSARESNLRVAGKAPQDRISNCPDLNAHLADFAAATPFGRRIARGFLTASTILAAIATRMPDPGTVFVAQEMRFVGPVRPDDTDTAEVTVKEVPRDCNRVILAETCQAGNRMVVDGQATVRSTSRARRQAVE